MSAVPRGFTLAELLIALVILGVIATFTIPKVLQTQQTSDYNAKAKEVAGMISGAFTIVKSQGLSSETSVQDFTPYFNYVRTRGNGSFDWYYNASDTCNFGVGRRCYELHTGGTLGMWGHKFCGETSNHAILFVYDPDSTQTTPQNSVTFYLYYNGKLRTQETVDSGTSVSNNALTPACGGGGQPGCQFRSALV